MASYNVNYNDERFTQVENEKQAELDKYNQTYDRLIDERNQFTNQQQGLVNQWEDTQRQIANDNLNHQIDLYNQQKDKAERDYQKEAKASYIDYQKEVDKYGVSRENVVQNGLSNSGYAESSKVDMYNTYQNRIATARESLNNIKLEFDNAIKEAQLQNNATLAENALTALQQKLSIALEGFDYKTDQENNRLNWNNTINNNYYDRYKDVESQINYENQQAEAIRQFNEQLAFQKEQQRQAQERWEKEMEYQRQQDAIANSQKWASINSSYSSGGGSGGYVIDDSSSKTMNPYTGTRNKDADRGTFSNGYQPNNINGNKLSSSGKTVGQLYPNQKGTTGVDMTGQKIWTSSGRYYMWDGSIDSYIDITADYKKKFK